MAPPVSYYNTPWGRQNSDCSETFSSRSSTSAFSHAPSLRCESPPQSISPSPKRGSISDLPATRVPGGYGHVMKTAQEAGFTPASRESVRSYIDRALPPTPTSITSVEEMTQRKRSIEPPLPTPTSAMSAYEVVGEDGRVRGVLSRKRRFLGLSALRIVEVQQESRQQDFHVASRGAERPGLAFESRAFMFDSPSDSSFSARSTVASSAVPAEPPSPAWARRMRKRAHWAMKWFDQYRDD